MLKGTANKKLKSSLPLILIFMLMFLMFPTIGASAAQGLDIYTTYPSIAAKPGENIETGITISNAAGTGLLVNLNIVSLPENWEAFIEGGGKIIDKIYIVNDDNEIFYLTVKIPNDVQEGRYTVVLDASSGSYSNRLNLEYVIKKDIDNKGQLQTNYTELKGSSDATFDYEIKLTNNKNESQTYSLGADVGRGWQVNFSEQYGSKQIASIPIEPNKTTTLKVSVVPPANVEAGEYTIPIAATSSSESLTAELKVIITGSYAMEVTTPTGRLNAETTAGKRTPIDILLQNTGSSELRDIKFTSWKPNGWDVEFEDDSIGSIAAGESATVKAYIISDEKAIAGDYVVSIYANSPEVSDSAEFRVMVKTSTIWGLVGAGLIILLVAGLYWVFNTYGRR
ncbi:MAG: NEW3 domain-containing protein [Acetivibrionales bacterium]|jgi:uncharacterized membrane protein